MILKDWASFRPLRFFMIKRLFVSTKNYLLKLLPKGQKPRGNNVIDPHVGVLFLAVFNEAMTEVFPGSNPSLAAASDVLRVVSNWEDFRKLTAEVTRPTQVLDPKFKAGLVGMIKAYNESNTIPDFVPNETHTTVANRTAD